MRNDCLVNKREVDIDIREIKKYRDLGRMARGALPAFILSIWMSSYISYIAIKKKMSPNQLTFLMFPFSILASVLMLFKPWYIKMIGALLVHFWFAFDLSDGQVARITKNFSKYGEELDYLAHQFCHIFFIVAFCFNLYQMERYSDVLILFIFAGMSFVEYAYRNVCSIRALMRTKKQVATQVNACEERKKSKIFSLVFKLVFAILGFFHSLDNYALIASILMFLDIFFKTDLLLYLSFAYVFATGLIVFISTFQLTRIALEN